MSSFESQISPSQMSDQNNWDLSAIVRSSIAFNFTTSTPITPLLPQTPNAITPQNTIPNKDLTFSQENGSFSFVHQPNSNGLLEPNHFGTFMSTTTNTITSDYAREQHMQQEFFQSQVADPMANYPFNEASNTSFDILHRQPNQLRPIVQTQLYQTTEHQKEVSYVQPIQAPDACPMALPKPPQPSKSKKRKNQLVKMAFKVTSDNLFENDVWAWRKYGQKHIKGTSYPRSYYRCNTFKQCVAKKLVERCNTDPNMFIVTYIGFHQHARPVQRNPNVGKAWSKSSVPKCLPATKKTGSPVKVTTTQNNSFMTNCLTAVEKHNSSIDAGSSRSPCSIVHDDRGSGTPQNGEVKTIVDAGESKSPDSLNNDVLTPTYEDILIPNLDAMFESYLIDFDY